MPRRAAELLGDDIKLIYLVRDPIARAISHHYHEFSRGTMPPTLEEALSLHPELISYSQYAMRLQAWFEYFDPKQIKLVVFEQFVKDRQAIVNECKGFLGVRLNSERIEENYAVNKAGQARPVTDEWRKSMQRHVFYQKVVRPLLPYHMRDKLRTLLLPRPPARPPQPSQETIQHIAEAVSSDVSQLRTMFSNAVIPWNLQVRKPQTVAS